MSCGRARETWRWMKIIGSFKIPPWNPWILLQRVPTRYTSLRVITTSRRTPVVITIFSKQICLLLDFTRFAAYVHHRLLTSTLALISQKWAFLVGTLWGWSPGSFLTISYQNLPHKMIILGAHLPPPWEAISFFLTARKIALDGRSEAITLVVPLSIFITKFSSILYACYKPVFCEPMLYNRLHTEVISWMVSSSL